MTALGRLHAPGKDVDLKLAGTDRQWAHWGEVEPYYAVYTDPKFRRANIGDTVGDFFASGEAEAAGYIAFQDRLYPDRPRGRMLDFGCGVGRLLFPLARGYAHAVGVDIAPAMIEGAITHAREVGATNLSFARSLDELEDGAFDYVHSTAVLQHLPVARQLEATAKLARKLAPGGVFSLQYAISDSEPNLLKSIKAVLRLPLEWGPIAELNRRLRLRDPNMRMVGAPLRAVIDSLEAAGVVEMTSTFQREGTWDAVTITGRRGETR
jgi:SAM-dependent methyltransferase